MKRNVVMAGLVILMAAALSCNNGMSSTDRGGGKQPAKRDRSQRTAIDSSEYFDFTTVKYNAEKIKKEDVLYVLGNATYKNGNSTIKVKMSEGVVEISSDVGKFNGKERCQVYGIFPFEVKAASGDCLYLRKDPGKEGYIMIDGIMFKNDTVPDFASCLPMYGYSRNRVEVSPIMDGYILMPSGTYWRQ